MSDSRYSPGVISMEVNSATCSCASEMVSKLLAAATATLDTDRDAAKACIQRAADLVRRSCIRESKAARGSFLVFIAATSRASVTPIAEQLGVQVRI